MKEETSTCERRRRSSRNKNERRMMEELNEMAM
jgi:hypothetical protein